MGYVDDAFEAMRKKAEVKPGSAEQNQAIARHTAIREHIEKGWEIERTFLTGSYDRHTKIRPLRDVDIFIVISATGAQAYLRHGNSGAALQALDELLSTKYSSDIDPPAVRVSFSPDDAVTSFEMVPAFEHSERGFLIPDRTGGWMRTDPDEHARLTAAKNAACNDMWVPFVKMVKGWNREDGEPISPSFLTEVMALELVRPPMSTYQDELVTFFENGFSSAFRGRTEVRGSDGVEMRYRSAPEATAGRAGASWWFLWAPCGCHALTPASRVAAGLRSAALRSVSSLSARFARFVS